MQRALQRHRQSNATKAATLSSTANLSRPRFFSRQATYVSYAVHSMENVLVRFVFISPKSRGVGKRNVETTKKIDQNQHQHKQAACTPHSTLCSSEDSCRLYTAYFSAFRQMRLSHSAVVSKAYVKGCNLNEVTTPARKN